MREVPGRSGESFGSHRVDLADCCAYGAVFGWANIGLKGSKELVPYLKNNPHWRVANVWDIRPLSVGFIWA